jgi:hypothetical protein
MRAAWLCALALVVGLPAGRSIQGQAQTPAFDVASVKPSRSADEESASFVMPGGRNTATNVTVRTLLRSA